MIMLCGILVTMIDYLFKTNGKLNIRKTVFIILAVLCMGVIFYFSSMNADDSTEESHELGKFVGYIVEYDFQNWSPDAQERYAAKLDHPIRKTAHFLEYMLLGILLTGALYEKKRSRKQKILYPFIIGALYAVSDELHQFFVGSGRACEVTDMLLDSGGVIVGILLAILNIVIFRKIFSNLY